MEAKDREPEQGQGPVMIPKDCKRLAEVDFPIAEVSRHAAREKSIRHGHPSTLHLWWARRPLASSRAVVLGLLWFIAHLATGDPAANRTYLELSRALVKAAHGEEPPLVVDPFAGGGSIPLEALRLGGGGVAGGLNPVARPLLQRRLR